MNKEFFEAVRSGNLNRVSEMLNEDNSLLAAKNENGQDPFLVAKYLGRNDIAAFLLEQGVELDVFTACIAGDEKRVTDFAAQQPGILNEYSRDGWTPLHLACFFGQPALVRTLLASGADAQARSRNAAQNMPIHAAASARNCDAVRSLLEHGADVNARQQAGWTALHAAAQNGDVETVRLLISKGARVHMRAENNQNALDLALGKGHQAVVDVLDQYAGDERGAS